MTNLYLIVDKPRKTLYSLTKNKVLRRHPMASTFKSILTSNNSTRLEALDREVVVIPSEAQLPVEYLSAKPLMPMEEITLKA